MISIRENSREDVHHDGLLGVEEGSGHGGAASAVAERALATATHSESRTKVLSQEPTSSGARSRLKSPQSPYMLP